MNCEKKYLENPEIDLEFWMPVMKSAPLETMKTKCSASKLGAWFL